MAKSVACRNAVVNAQAVLGSWFALHTGNPGTTGANEVSTAGAIYARQQTTFGGGADVPAANPARSDNVGSQVTFTIPAGTTPTHWSQRSASTGGVHIDGGALPNGGETYNGQGDYLLTPTISQVE